MQFVNTAAALAFVMAGMASAQNTFMVNTPSSLVQCQPVLITWTGGVAPYFPRINQPGSLSTIIENLPQTSDLMYSWTVNQPVGQTVTIVIGDSTGATAASGITPSVAAGSSTTCLSAAASSSLSSSVAASSSAGTSSAASTSSAARSSSTSSAAVTSSSAASSKTSSAATTASSSSSAPATTTSAHTDSAINVRGFAAVVAGTVGVVVAALL